MDSSSAALAAHDLVTRATTDAATRPPIHKVIGLILAIASGLLIGSSFVLKKKGLLRANVKYNEEAGEGYGYLKNFFWWSGMIMMIVGEICNFVAYAFADAILITPLGALSVVICTILSAIFLKERLSAVGKVACFLCIVGSVIIAINAPSQAGVANIEEMKAFVIAPGFLSYMGIIIIACLVLAVWAAPRYGKKSVFVYISICSLIGGLSVVATQGLGAAIVAQAGGRPQFNQWFLYIVLVFVIITLVTEIIYLNKALNLFNAALVTPTYYVYFTTSTIIASAILFQGWKANPECPQQIPSVVMGFLVICSGVVLLQLSKSAKDVPDAAVFRGDLDQIRTIAEVEEPESEPKADTIRGTAALIRRLSVIRQNKEKAEAQRIHEEKQMDLQPVPEDVEIQWDGVRRRTSTLSGGARVSSISRRKSVHPPLGMSQMPVEDSSSERGNSMDHDDMPDGTWGSVSRRARSLLHPQARSSRAASTVSNSLQVPLESLPTTHDSKYLTPIPSSSSTNSVPHIYGLPPDLKKHSDDDTRALSPPSYDHTSSFSGSPALKWAPDSTGRSGSTPQAHLSVPQPSITPGPTPPPHGTQLTNSARRQFSFTNVFHRNRDRTISPALPEENSRATTRKKVATPITHGATEEERCGLVKGDTNTSFNGMLPHHDRNDSVESHGSSARSSQQYYNTLPPFQDQFDTSYHGGPVGASAILPPSSSYASRARAQDQGRARDEHSYQQRQRSQRQRQGQRYDSREDEEQEEDDDDVDDDDNGDEDDGFHDDDGLNDSDLHDWHLENPTSPPTKRDESSGSEAGWTRVDPSIGSQTSGTTSPKRGPAQQWQALAHDPPSNTVRAPAAPPPLPQLLLPQQYQAHAPRPALPPSSTSIGALPMENLPPTSNQAAGTRNPWHQRQGSAATGPSVPAEVAEYERRKRGWEGEQQQQAGAGGPTSPPRRPVQPERKQSDRGLPGAGSFL